VELDLSVKFHLFFFINGLTAATYEDQLFVDLSNWKNAIFFRKVGLGRKNQSHYKSASADF